VSLVGSWIEAQRSEECEQEGSLSIVNESSPTEHICRPTGPVTPSNNTMNYKYLYSIRTPTYSVPVPYIQYLLGTRDPGPAPFSCTVGYECRLPVRRDGVVNEEFKSNR
jgi:hypothetical protein